MVEKEKWDLMMQVALGYNRLKPTYDKIWHN